MPRDGGVAAPRPVIPDTDRYRWAVLAAGTFSQASYSAIWFGVAVMAPLLRDEFHLSLGQTGLLLSGAVLTETVFALPGIGSWLANAIFNRDYPVIQGGILFTALVFVLVNLIVDISYGIINPRIRLS